MQTVTTRVQVRGDHKLTIQLPEGISMGEYEVVLVFHDISTPHNPSAIQIDPQDEELNNRWQNWLQDVEQLPSSQHSAQGGYQQHLLEKYREQGLEL